jgi:dTDP-4-dehydrorhamnose 3,5-epimerase
LNVQETGLDGVLLIEPMPFADERGWFMESWNAATYRSAGIPDRFVQDNHSCSGAGVLRGLHYQLGVPQGKLVRVAAGRVFDVAVDLRRSSASFGKWTGAELSAANKRQMWIPPGFAHGFLSLEAGSECLYKCTAPYAREEERTVLWSDPNIGIAWPLEGIEAPLMSERDRTAPLLRDADTYS